MIEGAFFRLKTKTIADSPHYWADRIDVREAVIFHPHQIKQRACRRIRDNYGSSRSIWAFSPRRPPYAGGQGVSSARRGSRQGLEIVARKGEFRPPSLSGE